jgi:hypothetical protein
MESQERRDFAWRNAIAFRHVLDGDAGLSQGPIKPRLHQRTPSLNLFARVFPENERCGVVA